MKGRRSLVLYKLHTVCSTTVENLSAPYGGYEWEAMLQLGGCVFKAKFYLHKHNNMIAIKFVCVNF
jgi:hypothetical protein